jgi:OmpA-OmpF porin, OOP family
LDESGSISFQIKFVGGFMRTLFIASLIAALAFVGGCQRQDAPPAATAAPAPQTPSALPTPAVQPATPAPVAEAPTAVAATPAPATAPPAADFDPASVPVTSATLPPLPFFKEPEGKRSVHSGEPKVRDRGFNRASFIGGKKLITVEGKLFRDMFNLEDAYEGQRVYSALEFHRNYENAITALGGKKISATQFTEEFIAANGGRDAIEKTLPGQPAATDHEHHSYLIRTPQKEYWIHVSSGSLSLHGEIAVLERTTMTQSVGLLDAAAMKKEIDAKGRVALYINFDVDKATLRPDAQPILAEINKLLTTNAALKLSIDGHTDSTGTAERNRELSAQRARSVLGALVGLGIDPARLASKGFGPDKPIADNADEAGRAKNRRVELVKIQ